MLLSIDKILTDKGTQVRDSVNINVVEEFADAKSSGDNLPLVDVVSDGVSYWMVDGFTRLAADLALGKTETDANIIPGDLEKAQWLSYSANKRNGQRRTRSELTKAARLACDHPESVFMTAEEVASHVGCSATLIYKIRSEKDAEVAPDEPPVEPEKRRQGRPKGSTKKEPEKAKEKPVVHKADAPPVLGQEDDDGNVVPESLREVFEGRNAFFTIERDMLTLITNVGHLMTTPAGINLYKDCSEQIGLLLDHIKASRPSVVTGSSWLSLGEVKKMRSQKPDDEDVLDGI